MKSEAGLSVRARVHDRKSPPAAHDFQAVEVRWDGPQAGREPMAWYGEYLWRSDLEGPSLTSLRVCAIDAAGNEACVPVPVAE